MSVEAVILRGMQHIVLELAVSNKALTVVANKMDTVSKNQMHAM